MDTNEHKRTRIYALHYEILAWNTRSGHVECFDDEDTDEDALVRRAYRHEIRHRKFRGGGPDAWWVDPVCIQATRDWLYERVFIIADM